MQGLFLDAPEQLRLGTLPKPSAPRAGEALVRVHRVGVCGTDLHAFRGRQPFFTYPRILGHELCVEIVALGEGETLLQIGDRCAVEPYLNCGACIACRKGKSNCCAHLQVLGVHTDGGLREFFTVATNKLHVSKTLSFDQLALVETLGIGAHAVARAQLEPDEWVLVIGAGPIGLGVMQFALEAGARVVALDSNQKRLEFCRQAMEIEYSMLAGDDTLQQICALTQDGPTAVFDATGNPSSMQRAFDFVAPGGRLVFVGLFSGDVTFHDPDFHRREMTLLASRNATGGDFKRIIALLEAGRIDTRPWMTHRASLTQTIEQFPLWLDPQNGVIKALISLDEPSK
ncbi:MAG TPA: zinc-binding alcohol dehydrogenase family protein [Abditibacteriaceae bacterium]|nr:zinc-binding alcohol dehydrogenase family protein [Abditibacteriaceae bacterium]